MSMLAWSCAILAIYLPLCLGLGLTSSLFSLCAFVAWPLSSLTLVIMTWMSPSSLRLQGEAGLAPILRGLVMGTDVRALHVCILVFIGRAAWQLLELYVLYKVPLARSLAPIASVVVGLGTAGLMAPCKDRIHDAGRDLYRMIDQKLEVARLPQGLFDLPGSQGSTSMAVALALAVGTTWAGAPVLLKWVLLPLLRVVLVLYASLSSLVAIYGGPSRRASASILREWVWYWMLSSVALPLMRSSMGFIPMLTKDVILFGTRCLFLLDRGRSLPYVRRAVLALKLFATSVPVEEIERGRWASLEHQLQEAWRLSRNVRTFEGADNEIRRRWRDAARRAAERSTPPPSRQPSANASGGTDQPSGGEGASQPSGGSALPVAECCILFTEIASGEPRAVCPHGHTTSAEGFARLFQDALDRRIEDLSPEERAASRYMPKCAAAGCGMHFGLREITVNLTEEMAISWEASNKELYAASRTASA